MANGLIRREGNRLIIRGSVDYFLQQPQWVRLMGALPQIKWASQYIADAIGLAAWRIAKKKVPQMIEGQKPTGTEVRGMGEIQVTFTLEEK